MSFIRKLSIHEYDVYVYYKIQGEHGEISQVPTITSNKPYEYLRNRHNLQFFFQNPTKQDENTQKSDEFLCLIFIGVLSGFQDLSRKSQDTVIP